MAKSRRPWRALIVVSLPLVACACASINPAVQGGEARRRAIAFPTPDWAGELRSRRGYVPRRQRADGILAGGGVAMLASLKPLRRGGLPADLDFAG